MTNHAEATFILASSSPRRQELLAGLGIKFQVDPSTEDESFEEGTPPHEVVKILSLRKAKSVAAKYENGIVIGADTIVVVGDEILGKPQNRDDAFDMLSKLQGKAHLVFSGISLVDASKAGDDSSTIHGTPQIITGHSVSKVIFRPMSDEEIWSYIKTGEPLDKAGAYGVQGLGAVFIERIEGDFYSVMGLPLNLLYQMLLKFGIRLLGY